MGWLRSVWSGRRAAALVGAVALSCLAPAVAARADDNAEARVLFERGNRHLEEAFGLREGPRRTRLLAEALEAYVESLLLVRSRNAVFNAGVTLEALGRFEEAFRYFREYVDTPGLGDAERAEGEARLDALRPRVAVLAVTSDPPGAAVRVDRPDLAPVAVTPAEIAVAPGTRTLIVEAEGHETARAEAVAARGERHAVHVTLDPRPPPPEPAPAPAPRAPDPATLQVRVLGAPSGRVLAGDELLGQGPLVVARLPPGPHDLRVEAAGHRPAQASLTLEEGLAYRLEASLARDEERRKLGRWPLALGIATGVVGAATVGVTAWLLAEDAAIDDRPNADPTDDERWADRLDRVRRLAVAQVALLSGLVVLGVATLVAVLRDGPLPPLESTVRVLHGEGP